MFCSDGGHEGKDGELPLLEAEEDVDVKSVETLEESSQEKRTDATSSHGQEDSDDEPLVNFDLPACYLLLFSAFFLGR